MRGLATRRARWNPRLPLAIGAVVVLGAALPAALAVGGGTMLDDGVRSAVAAAGPGDRGTQVSARLDDADPAAQDRAAREVVGRVFEGVPATTWTGLRSGNLPLTGLPASPAGEIRLVAEVLPDAAAHAELVTGRWPAATPGGATVGAPIPAALHAGAARTLGIAAGDRLTLGTPGTPAVRAVDVVGLWQVPDAADPYWFGDPLELTGAERATVQGPLLVAAGPDGTPPDVGERWTARWRTVVVDPAGLEAGDAERLTRRLARLEAEVEAIPTAGGGVARTAGGLAETLAYPRLAVPLARSATVAVLVLVVGLAALVAAQAAALLAADRGRESGVIRARGASRVQLARLTTVELLAVAALAVVPTALLAIATLASPLGPAEGRAGPVALSAALGCLALALVVSAGVQVLLARSHGPRAPAAPRATVGLALAAALGLALWQVWAAAPRGGGTTPGAATLDPVLVVAPAVALGAAGVLAVRALGPLGRVLGRLARRDGAVPALVGWHAARRGTRPAAPLVALVVVAALAVVALSAGATVEHATRDRTAAESGGDVAVTGSALRPPADDSGGESVTPVVDLAGSFGEEGVQVLAADTAALPVVTSRAGRWALTEDDVRGLASDERGGIPLPPGDVLSLTLRMVTTVALLPDGREGDAEPGGAPAQRAVTALLAGGDGTQRTLRLPDLLHDGRSHTLTARLPADLAGTARLVGLEVDVPASTFTLLTTTLDVERLVAANQDAPGVRRMWTVRPLGDQGAGQDGSHPEVRTGVPGVVVRLTTIPFGSEGTVTMRLLPDPAASPTALPAVLDRRLAARIGASPGDLVDADVAGETLKLSVVRTVDGVPGGRPPGVPDDGLGPAVPAPGVLVDLAALGEASRQLGRRALPDPVDWWLGSPHPRGTADAVGEALPDAGVSARDDLVERRLADPFNEGLRRILLLAALAALAVALGALLLGDVVTAAGRRTELVVLRALGMAGGQVRRLLVVERVLVGGAALVVGLVLGLAVSPVLVPALTGVPVADGAGVQVAWLPVAGVAVALAAVVAAGAVAAARRAARLEPAVVLREDAG